MPEDDASVYLPNIMVDPTVKKGKKNENPFISSNFGEGTLTAKFLTVWESQAQYCITVH